MHIGLLADRDRIAEAAGHLGEHLVRAQTARRVGGHLLRPQGQRMHCSVPGAEILRGERCAAGLADVVVDIARADCPRNAGFVLVLEQVLAGHRLATPHDLGDARVLERDLVDHAALAAKAQPQRAPADSRMAIAQGRQPVRVVGPRIFIVTDAHERRVEQPHQRRKHRLARRLGYHGLGQISCHPTTNARQGGAELEHPLELVCIAGEPPFRVISVLLAPARIATGGLQVAARMRADPDVLVGRRDRQLADPLEIRGVANRLPVRMPIDEALTFADAPDARAVVADINQTRRHHLDGGHCDCRRRRMPGSPRVARRSGLAGRSVRASRPSRSRHG